MGADRAAIAGVPLLHPVSPLACLQRSVRHQRQQSGGGCGNDPECAVSGAARQDDQIHDSPHGSLSGLPARIPRRLLRHTEALARQVLVSGVRKPLR